MSDDDTFVLCDNDIAGQIVARTIDPWFAMIRDSEREFLIGNGFKVTLFDMMHKEIMKLLEFASHEAQAQKQH